MHCHWVVSVSLRPLPSKQENLREAEERRGSVLCLKFPTVGITPRKYLRSGD